MSDPISQSLISPEAYLAHEKRRWHEGRFGVVATYGAGDIIRFDNLQLDLAMSELYP